MAVRRANNSPQQPQQPSEKKGPLENLYFPIQGGSLCVSIWTKEFQNDNGNSVLYSVTVQRSYYKEKQRSYTEYVRESDLPVALIALQQAYLRILELKQPQNGQQESPPF